MAGHARWVRRLHSGRPLDARSRHSVILVTIIATTLGALVMAPPAYANPTPEEIEAQIDEAWQELEPIIEEHNATRIELEEDGGGARRCGPFVD